MKNLYLPLLLLLFISVHANGQNTAIVLDGVSEHLVIPGNVNHNVDEAFTVEAWIFANSWETESWRGSLVAKDAQGPDRGYAFRCGDNGKLSFVISVDGTWEEIISPPLMATNQWHHVAGVVNGTNTKLYIDGQEVAAGSYDGTPSILSEDLLIGGSYFDGRFFDGAIDELRIWNVARTQQEIADFADQDLTGTEANLAVYLPMNEGSGSIATNVVDDSYSASGVGIDDSNWIEGYSLPEFDLTLRSLANIDLLNAKTRPQNIIVDVQNVGLQEMSDFDISIEVNGDLVFTESVSQAIASGELLSVALNTPLDLTQLTSPEILARLSHPDDANGLNNDFEFGFVNSQDNRVNLFSQEQHNFGAAGQNKGRMVTLPTDLSEYSQILMHLNLSCPSGGCDPWDQPAQITALHDGVNYEIVRYITPYGIACGNWTVDVTDFKSVLTGNTLFNSYIQVWGPNGWLLDADLEFVEGENDLPYSKITSLWADDYVVYGDPDISHDLPEQSVSVEPQSEASHIRMHLTGHGQGNTNNAAEFYEVIHSVQVNGAQLAQDYLWNDDCASNACANQAGNWLFPRAGWCPGEEVQPRIFETTSEMNGDMTFDYELQDYTNLLNTGYNSSGHTEPHYRLHGNFVEQSSERYSEYNNLSVNITQLIIGSEETIVQFQITNNGDNDLEAGDVNFYFQNDFAGTAELSDLVPAGETLSFSYTVADETIYTAGNIIFFAELTNSDHNPGDDVARIEVDFTIATDDLYLNKRFNIQPNPSPQNIQVSCEADLLGARMELFDLAGRLLHQQTITSNSQELFVKELGTYFLKVTDLDGHTGVKKLIVID